jgi:DNA polymerase-3 subunit theta
MPVVAEVVEREQPEHLRNWFRERLIAHRLASVNLSRLPYEPKSK